MAVWENAIITDKGMALLAKLAEGNTLSLVGAVAGTGYVDPDELQSQTAVSGETFDLTLATQSYPESGKCAVPVKLTNTGVTTAVMVTQVGITAFDPDDGDILFLISQATDGDGTEVPAESDMPGYSVSWTFYIQYGQADGVDVVVDPSNTVTAEEVQTMIDTHNTEQAPHADVLATKEELAEHINNLDNPHGVTKEQLGLGNVNNTADNDKYVAYAQRAGEADQTKYSLTIRLDGGRTEGSDMWTFNGATSRSVNITADSIGAAEADHVQDMTAGGTGATNGATGLKNLFAAGYTVLSDFQRGDEFPADAPEGTLFFKRVST